MQERTYRPNHYLRAAREEKLWTQEEAAEYVGVDPQTYWRWENGEQKPRKYALRKLCEVFGKRVDDLGFVGMPEGADSGHSSEQTTKELDSSSDEPPLLLTHGQTIILTQEQVAALSHLLGDDFMAHYEPSKRRTLKQIQAALKTAAASSVLTFFEPEPWQRLALTTTQPTTINRDTIQHFNHLLNTCRALSNGSELLVAERLLDTFLPRLQEAAPHQSEVAGLAAQGLLLKSIFTAHNLHLQNKISLCQTAVERAKQSADPNLIAAGYLQLGVAFHYASQHSYALKMQQEALSYAGQASPLVQSHIYTEIAPTLAQFARAREADFYIHLAYEVFPEDPKLDPGFAFDDHGFFNLALYKGIMYNHLTHPQAAWETFEEGKKSPGVPERMRLEIVNHQGRSAMLANDLDKYAACLQDGLAGAVALKSKKRFDEAFSIFLQAPTAWQKEHQLKPLIEQYQLLPS